MTVQPNKDELAKFVGAVFKHADPETFVSLRSFPQIKGKGPTRISAVGAVVEGIIGAAFKEVRPDASSEEARVFCPPVATFNNERKADRASLAQALVLAVDLDKLPKKGLAELERVLGPATMVVASGGMVDTPQGRQKKRHAYWRLKEPASCDADFDLVEEALRIMARIGHTDPTALSIVHPLRWAGSVHEKGTPRLAKILELNADREIDLQWALKALRKAASDYRPAVAKTASKKTRAKNARPIASEAESTADLIHQLMTAASYHGPLTQLAMRHARQGVAQSAIVEMLQGLMLGVPPDKRAATAERQRWDERFNDIDRLVATAVEKLESEVSWLDPLPLPTVRSAVPAFTEDMLPKRFRKWLDTAADAMQLPLDFVAIPAITAAGAAVGRRLGIQPKRHDRSWVEVPNLWGCVVGSPAAMKSPAASVGLAPLQSFEIEARSRNKTLREEHARAMRAYRARLETLKPQVKKRLVAKPDDNIDDLIGDPPEKPKEERYILNDVTPERLGEINADNPGGILVHRDELAPFLTRLERDDKADERALFLSGWSGLEGYAWDRVGRGHISIPAVCLSVFGTTQPDKIVPYIQKLTGAGDGLIQRFGLFVWPDIPREWCNIDKPYDQAVLDRVRTTFRRLMRIDPTKLVHATLSPKGVYVLNFSPKAQRRFERWHKSLELRLRRESLPPIIESHLGKYRGLVPSLALLFHLIDGEVGPVSLNAVKLAIRWAGYLEAHAFRIYGTVVRADVLGAEVLLEHIKKGDLAATFSARDVRRPSWRYLTDIKLVEAALSVLMDCQIVRRRIVAEKGRKTTVYDVNPKLKVEVRKPRA